MNLLLVGGGRMGAALLELCQNEANTDILAVVDETNPQLLAELPAADAAIDFSAPAALPALAAYVARTGTPLASGTTGFSESQLETLKSLGRAAPVLHSANYSVGIAALRRALPALRAALGEGFDIELVEAHHAGKKDAPSGTAALLADALDALAPRVYGRGPGSAPRRAGEIGLHSLRGGSVAGSHSVHFFGPDETLSLTHEAADRRIFARGALRAARALAGMPPGWYTLDEVLFGGGDANGRA